MIRTTSLFKNAIKQTVNHPSVPLKNLTKGIKSDPPNPWFIFSAAFLLASAIFGSKK